MMIGRPRGTSHPVIKMSQIEFDALMKTVRSLTDKNQTNRKWWLFFMVLREGKHEIKDILKNFKTDTVPPTLLWPEISAYVKFYNVKGKVFPDTYDAAYYIFRRARDAARLNSKLTIESVRVRVK